MTAAEWLDAIEVRATTATPGPWRDGMGTHGLGADGPSFVTVDAIAANGAVNRVAELMLDKDGAADAEFIANARADVPALVAVLRAVLALHRSVPVYDLDDKCACEDRDNHDVMESRNGDLLCLASPTGSFICDECSHDDQDEETAYPCPTVRAVTAALDGAL